MTQSFALHHGDCLDVMRGMQDNSVDSIVTDPPYGLRFMGHAWDYDVPTAEVWCECLRVLKPGGHLLAFAGTRTQHRMAVRIEDAGFEMRDMMAFLYDTESVFRDFLDSLSPMQLKLFARALSVDALFAWIYGSGFPKSKNLDGEWQGWGTALKPALEPITVARKPLIGTVAANVLQHGTGAINIDGCRVEGLERTDYGLENSTRSHGSTYGEPSASADFDASKGRWPANLIHDGSEEVLSLFPDSNGSGGSLPNVKITGYGDGIGTGKSEYFGGERIPHNAGTGSAARFFYCAKASRSDRNEGLSSCDQPAVATSATMRECEDAEWSKRNGNHHPTVKPTDLMRYLCRLVTPLGGTVLDPYMGSGSTGKAAILEGFRFVGIDIGDDNIAIAAARIKAAQQQRNDATRQSELFGAAA